MSCMPHYRSADVRRRNLDGRGNRPRGEENRAGEERFERAPLVLVSRAPQAKLKPFKKRMGWTVPWFSSFGSDFNADFGVTSGEEEKSALSVFLRDGDSVYRTYFTSARGAWLRLEFPGFDATRSAGGLGGLTRRMAANATL